MKKTADKLFGEKYKYMSVLKYTVVVSAVFFIAFSLLRFPEKAAQGISRGIKQSVEIIVPSLFPFMVLSGFIAELDLFGKPIRPIEKCTNFLFALPGVSAFVILLSQIGGFPIGAKTTCRLYEKGTISAMQGKRLLLFCIGPGPGFVISYIGSSLLGSTQAGAIIYASVVLSSLMTGFALRFFPSDIYSPNTQTAKEKISVSAALVNSAGKSSSGIIAICTWVIIFNAASEIISLVVKSDGLRLFLTCILEVTTGCEAAVGKLPIEIIAGIISWGGVCVHLQIMSAIIKLRLKLKYFLTSRIICACTAVVICRTLLYFFPVHIDAIKKIETGISCVAITSFPVSAGLLIMCALLMLGNNFNSSKKNKKYTVE